MFAPSFTVGANEAAIPYVDRVTRTPFPQLTNMAVTEKILQDCEEALSLLKVSDPFGPAADNTEPEDEFLRNREERELLCGKSPGGPGISMDRTNPKGRKYSQ